MGGFCDDALTESIARALACMARTASRLSCADVECSNDRAVAVAVGALLLAMGRAIRSLLLLSPSSCLGVWLTPPSAFLNSVLTTPARAVPSMPAGYKSSTSPASSTSESKRGGAGGLGMDLVA